MSEHPTKMELAARFAQLLDEFKGQANTPFTRTRIEAALDALVHEVDEDQNRADWFSVDVEEDASNVSHVTVTPNNIYAALLMTGFKNPPLKTVVCQRYEDDEFVWEMVNGRVVVTRKPMVEVTFTLEEDRENGRAE